MKIHLILSILVTASMCVGQDDYTKVYYPAINEAELAIITNDYQAALGHYQRAFKAVSNHGFGVDYYNAMMCSDEIGEIETGLYYLEKLIAKGVERDFFLQNEHLFKTLRYEMRWADLLDEYELRQQETFGKTVNNTVKGELGKILYRDNEAREARRQGQNIDVLAIDSANIASLLEIVSTHGFPTEEMIGIRFPTDVNNDLYFYVIWHHLRNWAAQPNWVDLRPLIKDWIRAGKLHPEQGMSFLNLANRMSSGGDTTGYGQQYLLTFQGAETYYMLIYPEAVAAAINRNRHALSLESLADYRRKQVYQRAHGWRYAKFRLVNTVHDSFPAILKADFNLAEIK